MNNGLPSIDWTSHELTSTAAYTARHAVRSLAATLFAYENKLAGFDGALVGAELRDVFTSLQESLYMLEECIPLGDAVTDVRGARRCAEDAARLLHKTFPVHVTGSTPMPGCHFDQIGTADEIEELDDRRELVVDGYVYRITVLPGYMTRVRDLRTEELISPESFIRRFGNAERGILLRH